MTVAEEGLPAEGTVAEGAAAGVAVAPQRRGTSFAGDVLKLVSGTTLAQAIGVLVTPILTRMYAPEAFGTLALFTGVVGIIGAIACLRYELAIMLPETDEEAANILAASMIVAVLISLLAILLIVLFGRPLSYLLRAPHLVPFLWLIPLAILFAGLFLALNYWNSRTKQYARLAVARVVNTVTTSGTKLGAGYAGQATGGSLVGGSVLGSVVSTLALGWQIWRDDAQLFRSSVRWPVMWSLLKRYIKFPRYSMPSGLLNAISWQLPAFLLSYFFSSTIVGYYDLGHRVVRMPMSLIGAAIAQVFFQRAAHARADGRLAEVALRTFDQLTSFGLIVAIVLTVTGRDLFTVVMGSDWQEAGIYSQILGFWTFFWLISTPLSGLLNILEKQELHLTFNIVNVIARALGLAVGGICGDARLAIALFALAGTAVYGYLCLRILIMAGSSIQQIAHVVSCNLLRTLPLLLCLLVSYVVISDPVMRLLVACAAAAVHAAICVSREPALRAILLRRGGSPLQ